MPRYIVRIKEKYSMVQEIYFLSLSLFLQMNDTGQCLDELWMHGKKLPVLNLNWRQIQMWTIWCSGNLITLGKCVVHTNSADFDATN